jgi:hypothetical protein
VLKMIECAKCYSSLVLLKIIADESVAVELGKIPISDLYHQDFARWVDETLQQLQNRNIADLDWEHLIEEIEALGSEQKRKVRSYLKQLFIHLLLYRYWLAEKENCERGWREEIENFRDELDDLLESKTLYNYGLQERNRIYAKARSRAIQKTGLDPSTFPADCPFSWEEVLDFEFLP